jgi:cobalt-zinc-cadmium efflux system protein
MVLTGVFMLVEGAGGLWAGSLALMADAGHMLGDVVSLLLAWFAFKLSRRKWDLRRTYGYHRFQVLAAFVNGLSLLVLSVWICVEAVTRFFDPVKVLAGPMLVIAVVGLLVNILSFWILSRGSQDNLNLRGAVLHVLGDLLGSVAAIAAAVIILTTGWEQADPVLSILAAALIVRAGWSVVAKSGHILLEGAPESVSAEDIRRVIAEALPDVLDVHHVHIWSLTNERPVLSMHVRVEKMNHSSDLLMAIHRVLFDRFGIAHATVQIEEEVCSDRIEATSPAE